MKTEKEILETDDKLKPLIIAFSVIMVVWILSFVLIFYSFDTWGDRGTFGDAFGAINSLFSGLAFAGIVYTILLQRKELTLQRMELVETRKELRRSADAQEKSEQALSMQIKSMQTAAKLNALNSLVESYGREEENFMRLDISKHRFAKGRKEMFLKEIEQTLKSIEEEQQKEK